MGWSAIPTSRNTLHVMNTETMQHFEAADEAEVQEVLAAIKAAEDEKKAAEDAATASTDPNALTMPQQGGPVTETPAAPEVQPEAATERTN
jgi:hypothetical protein